MTWVHANSEVGPEGSGSFIRQGIPTGQCLKFEHGPVGGIQQGKARAISLILGGWWIQAMWQQIGYATQKKAINVALPLMHNPPMVPIGKK